MYKRRFIVILAVVLMAFLAVGCGGTDTEPGDSQAPVDGQPAEEQREPQEEASTNGDLVFVSSADYASCEDCHQKISDELDLSMEAMIANLDSHPEAPVGSGVADDCLSCHPADNEELSLKTVLHESHYSSGDNLFLTDYDGSCVHCHKLTDEGALPVAGLEPEGSTFITVEVASVDKSPGGCTDCHQDLAASVANIDNHPEGPDVPMDTLADCVSCHAEGTPLALSKSMHTSHLQGEAYKNFGNSCLNCHEEGVDMLLKGL